VNLTSSLRSLLIIGLIFVNLPAKKTSENRNGVTGDDLPHPTRGTGKEIRTIVFRKIKLRVEPILELCEGKGKPVRES